MVRKNIIEIVGIIVRKNFSNKYWPKNGKPALVMNYAEVVIISSLVIIKWYKKEIKMCF